MKSQMSKFVTVTFLVFFGATAVAQEESFTSLNQYRELAKKCGDQTTAEKVLTALKNADKFVEMAVGGLLYNEQTSSWTENTLAPEIFEPLALQAKQKFDAAKSCSEAGRVVMTYQNIGVYSLGTLRLAFKKIVPGLEFGHGYIPVEEFFAVYEQCTSDYSKNDRNLIAEFVNNRARAITGKATIFDRYTLSVMNHEVLSALLNDVKPKNCAQVASVNNKLIEGYMKADALIRKEIERDGFTIVEPTKATAAVSEDTQGMRN